MLATVSPLTAKSTSAPAVLKFTRPFVSVISSPLITMLPPCNAPAVAILPPVMLPVALAVPPVAILPPVIVAVALTVPPVAMLPPVIVAVALKVPPVAKLPLVTVLVVLSNVNPLVALATPLSLNITCVFEPGALMLPETLPMKLAP